MNSQNSTLFKAYARVQRIRTAMTTMLAATFIVAQVVPSYATIDNTANAVGTYSGVTTSYGSATQNVPVAPPLASMTIVKTAAAPSTALGVDPVHTDSGDTITYTYTVKNTGNVTMNGVAPVDPGPTFNGSAAAGSLGAFAPVTATLAPGATQVFTAVYTLAQLDVLHGAGVANGVSNTAGAAGNFGPGPTAYAIPGPGKSTATTTIAAFAQMSIAKTYVLAKFAGNLVAGKAELNDTVTYTYVACNTGNVLLTAVQVLDNHAGSVVPVGAGGIAGETLTTNGPLGAAASTDATANNGIWSNLAAGACTTFTWAHTVTQTEVNNG